MEFTTKDIKEGSKALANYLADEIQAAEDARRPLSDRWSQVEAKYGNPAKSTSPTIYDNFPPKTVPSLSPAIDRVVTVTVNALTGPSTWVQAVPDDRKQAQADELEAGAQTIFERAGFVRLLRKSCLRACLCGVSVVKVWMTAGGLRLAHVHPNDFVVAPTFGLEIEGAHLVAHRFFLPRWKVKERAEKADGKEAYYDLIEPWEVERLGQKDPDDVSSGRDQENERSEAQYPSTDKDNDEIELWEVLARIKVDGERKWCRFVVSAVDFKCLLYEPYPYDRPWYFDLRFHDEEGKFWPATSKAQSVVGLAMLDEDITNLAVVGEMANAATPTVISGPGALGKKIKSVGIGSVWELSGEVKVQGFPSTFRSEGILAVRELIQTKMDAQTKVSQLAKGQEFLTNETATAANAIIAATSENEGDSPNFLADFVEPIWKFAHEQLFARHTKTLLDVYGTALSTGFYASLKAKVRWRMTGASPGNSPQALAQKGQALYQMSLNPQSGLSQKKCARFLVGQLNLPIPYEELELDEEELAALAAAALQGQAAPTGAAPGGQGVA